MDRNLIFPPKKPRRRLVFFANISIVSALIKKPKKKPQNYRLRALGVVGANVNIPLSEFRQWKRVGMYPRHARGVTIARSLLPRPIPSHRACAERSPETPPRGRTETPAERSPEVWYGTWRWRWRWRCDEKPSARIRELGHFRAILIWPIRSPRSAWYGTWRWRCDENWARIRELGQSHGFILCTSGVSTWSFHVDFPVTQWDGVRVY